jgi:uncharacterized protein YacL
MGLSEFNDAIIALVSVSACVVVFFIFLQMKKRVTADMSENNFTIRQPKMILWLGIVGTALFIALLVMVLITYFIFDETNPYFEPITDISEMIILSVIFLGFALLSSVAIIAYFVEKLHVYGSAIDCHKMFRKKRTLRFSDITHVKLKQEGLGNETLILYAGKKKIFGANSYCAGYDFLWRRLRKEGVRFI